MIYSEAEFERLPDGGRWEVVDGRSILLPPSDVEHQFISDALVGMFREQLKATKGSFAVSAPNVFIPSRLESSEDSRAVFPMLPSSRIGRNAISRLAILRSW